VLEGQPKLPSALEKGLENEGEGSDEAQLDLTLGTFEKTDHLVRIYLRQMGAVPLLTRQGELVIAKRIERGQRQVLKALSRSPVVIPQILAISKDLRHGIGSITDIVVFDEKEVSEEILQNRVEELTRRIDELQKHYKRVGQLAERLRLSTIPSQKKGHQYLRCRCRLARERVRISLIIRNPDLTNVERKRLIDQVNQTVDMMRSLDRQISDLEKKIESNRKGKHGNPAPTAGARGFYPNRASRQVVTQVNGSEAPKLVSPTRIGGWGVWEVPRHSQRV
jgi:RNA polymerase primary sigma factor